MGSMLAMFVLVCIFVGPLLLLLDIRRSLRRLEELNETANTRQPRGSTVTTPVVRGIPEADHWSAT